MPSTPSTPSLKCTQRGHVEHSRLRSIKGERKTLTRISSNLAAPTKQTQNNNSLKQTQFAHTNKMTPRAQTNTNTTPDINTISAVAQYTTGANQQQAQEYDVMPRHSNNNNRAEVTETNGQAALAQIHESTSNIERIANNKAIRETLADILREQGIKEKVIRQSTISFINKNIDTKEISKTIDSEWVFSLNQAPVTVWNDKDYLHCQFIDNEAKINFLASGIASKPPLTDRAIPMNEYGENFKRRPIRMIINNVRPAIKTERVVEILRNCTDFDTDLTEIKDGSPHPVTKTRSIFFKINGHGLRVIVEKLNGEIPYAEKENHVKARLRTKINCKPWQCKDCLALGVHQCEGKRCKNCSNKGHTTKECLSKTKFCGNCKRKGHRSNDIHCQSYLNEIGRELRKMDIPMDMFATKESRTNLAKCIQLK